MEFWFQPASPEHVKKQKALARELRKTPWWNEQLQTGLCHYCQGEFSKEDLTMDHKVPIIRGGKTTKSNIVVACKPCNTDKKYQTDVEFISGQ